MFKQLKQFLANSNHGRRTEKPVAVLDRLRRECARQTIDQERRAPSRPDQPVQVGRPPIVPHDTKLDLEKTPHALANDTRLDLPRTSSVREAAPTTPSLLQKLRSWFRGPEVVHAERRTAPRHAFGQAHPQARVLVGPCKWPAQVTDVSATGIGLILGMRHRLGADMQLTVQDRSLGSSFPIKAKVKRLALRPDGTWFTCYAFDRPLDEAGLKVML
jgi:hypothetical protein